MLFVGFDHKLVEQEYICLRQAFNWLHTETHHCFAIFYYLDKSSPCTWHPVNTALRTGAWHLQIAVPEYLMPLLRSKYIAKQMSRSPVSTRPASQVWLQKEPDHRRNSR